MSAIEKKDNVPAIWWEKTVEYQFIFRAVDGKWFTLLAPLAKAAETQMGDAALENSDRYFLIEYKRTSEEITSEYMKFVIEDDEFCLNLKNIARLKNPDLTDAEKAGINLIFPDKEKTYKGAFDAAKTSIRTQFRTQLEELEEELNDDACSRPAEKRDALKAEVARLLKMDDPAQNFHIIIYGERKASALDALDVKSLPYWGALGQGSYPEIDQLFKQQDHGASRDVFDLYARLFSAHRTLTKQDTEQEGTQGSSGFITKVMGISTNNHLSTETELRDYLRLAPKLVPAPKRGLKP